MLCEYLIILLKEINSVYPEKDNIKKCLSKFIERVLVQIKLCQSSNPFKLPNI